MDLHIFNVSSEFAWNLKPSEECLSANYKDIRFRVAFSEWSKARKRMKDTNRRRKGLQLKIKSNHVGKRCILQHLKTEVYRDVWLVNWIVLLQHSLIEKNLHNVTLSTLTGHFFRYTKIGQKKIGKTLPGLMSLDFCCKIQMVGSEFGIKKMKAWIHPALSQQFRLLVVSEWCEGYFLGTLWAT